MSVPAFWAHMCASPRSESTEHKDGLPVAFQSGVIPHSGTFLTEDIWFTYRSWLLGRGCYVIPDVCVGHVMPVAVFPEEDAAQVLIDESEAQSPAEPTPKESNLPPSPEAAPPETAPE